MNLGSRCGGCGTLFRVVRDQLWISDGWVRCGRCSRVFNAFDQLYDLEQGKPPPWVAAEARVAASAAGEATAAAELESSAAGEPASESEPRIEAEPQQLAMPRLEAVPAEEAPVGEAAPDGQRSVDTARAEPEEVADEAGHSTLPELLVVPGDLVSEPATSATLPMPDFVRRAEKQARWNRPAMRLALGAVALVALTALLLQTGLHFRDRLAAESPQARRALAWLCAKFDCRIELPRRIADLTVESSALSRVAGDERLIRLSLTVRNRGRLQAAFPAIDLSLKDGTGKVVVRRAIRPEELPAAPAALPAGVDVPLQLLVSTEGRRVAGYTIELFYP